MSDQTSAFGLTIFLRGLATMAELLHRAEKHAEEHKIEPAAFLTARLYPDMYTLTRQVQIAADTAKRTAARLAGIEAPSYEDNEASFAELQARVAKTVDFLKTVPADALLADKRVAFKAGPNELDLSATEYLVRFGLPNFYFHLVTAYDILRHNGVVVGKFDFLGNLKAD